MNGFEPLNQQPMDHNQRSHYLFILVLFKKHLTEHFKLTFSILIEQGLLE